MTCSAGIHDVGGLEMHAFLVSLTLFGQTGVALPPAPDAEKPPAVAPASAPAETVEELRNWLLARLIVDLSFDAQKSTDVGRLIKTMDEPQMRALVAYYKERAARRDQAFAVPQQTNQQQALEQAKLDQQQAEAYRDHLKREYDRQILQGHMTQNLVYQNIVNNQRLSYLSNGPFTYGGFGYSPYGYGGYGYGISNYGGFVGYGNPGFGNSMMYTSPWYGGGIGY